MINPINFAGKPAPQKELTNEYNVLEAGLWNSISLSKGIVLLTLMPLKENVKIVGLSLAFCRVL